MVTRHRGQAEKSALEKAAQAFAQTKLGSTLFTTVFPAIDRKLMPLTRGKVRMSLQFPSLVLHCRGAKSGQPRAVPLVYTPRGDDLVLIGSRGGHERHPAWYHNLKAHPDVEVEVDGRRRPVRAREAEGAERDELWALATDHYSGFATYQQRAGERRIPVMVLEPRSAA